MSIFNKKQKAVKSEPAIQKIHLMQKIVESSGEVILVTDLNGVITFVNPEFTRLYGYEPDEVVGKTTPLILKSECEQDKVFENFNKKIQNREIFQTEFTNRTKYGNLVNVEVTINPIISDAGDYKGYIAIQRDITGRIKNEMALKRSEWLFSNAIDFLPDPTFVINTKHEIIVWNKAKEVHTGIKASEALGKKYGDIFLYNREKKYSAADLLLSPDSGTESKYYRFERSSDSIVAELLLRGNSGTESDRYIWITASTLYDEKGEVFGAIESIRDITERKKAEIELKRAKEIAEESNSIKTTLLENMSHEFRTPLMGILGLSDIMRKEQEDSKLGELAEGIYSSGKRLLSTLTSILSLSQLSDPELKIELKAINLRCLFEKMVNKWAPVAKTKGLNFICDLPDSDITIDSDEEMLKTILNNLLDNAVKFTVSGSVKLELKNSRTGLKNWAVMSVSDTGIGITKENLGIIFNEFRQVSSGYGRNYEGCGLGLTLAKKMTEKLRGEIEIQSIAGQGSAFTVMLPLEDNVGIKAEEIIHTSNKPFPVKQNYHDGLLPEILFVEDNALNAMAARVYLRDFCRMDHAADGLSALDMIKIKKYALILMDINLGPGLNGIEVLKEIRKNKVYELIPAIAVTGYATPKDTQTLLAEGFDFYLAKPFEKEEIADVVREAFVKGQKLK